MKNRIKHVPPWFALLIIAPLLGELVSVHQTPLEFFNPMNFVVLSLPYGFGAIICRELIIRWNKGFINLLFLGAAYGVYEEALVVYSVFDSGWKELGSLAGYGSFGGVNWTWGGMTVHFHVFISICASVVIAGLLYPERRNHRWLSNRGLAACFAGFLLWIPVMWSIMILFDQRQLPPAGLYLSACAVVLLLGFTAYILPSRPLNKTSKKIPKPVFFFLAGFLNISVFFISVFITPELKFIPLWITILWLILLDAGTVIGVLYWSGNGYGWDDRHRLAFVSGMLMFFIYFSFDKDIEHWTGTSIVGILTIIGLWRLKRNVWKREEESG